MDTFTDRVVVVNLLFPLTLKLPKMIADFADYFETQPATEPMTPLPRLYAIVVDV